MRTPAAWWRSVKRRKPGIYAYRTRKHLRPGTEWGYVGKSRHLPSRDADHHGRGRYGHAAKPWIDLKVRRYALELPWWLGWDWLTLSLETLAILVLRPRYNWAKNPRRSKVGPRQQIQQRWVRDTVPTAVRAHVERQHVTGRALQVVGILIIIIGVGGMLWAR
jgi:hypothetical protein